MFPTSNQERLPYTQPLCAHGEFGLDFSVYLVSSPLACN